MTAADHANTVKAALVWTTMPAATRDALAALDALEADRDRLADALRDLAAYGPLENTTRWAKMDSGHRAALIRARAALAQTEHTPQRHGRGCGCTPCKAEDWDAIDAGLARTEHTPEPPPWTTMHDGALDAATRAQTEHTPFPVVTDQQLEAMGLPTDADVAQTEQTP